MHMTELETPSVLIDLDRMEANIQRMQEHCDSLGLAFRPHIKTHKIPAIARLQIDAGAKGLACQKLTEAEVFADAGFNDLLLPYNIIGAAKLTRLTDLALYNRVTVAADSEYVIRGLVEAAQAAGITLRVAVDIATEIERTGANASRAIQLARIIDRSDHLVFAGLMVYPSNATIRPVLQEILDQLHQDGIGVEMVSGGGTGAALQAHEVPELTELRVGTYVFNDWTTVRRGWTTLEHCAMTVTATVVSRPSENRAILDAGSKTLTPETVDGGYGHIVEYPQARIFKLNEEHGFVDVSACDPAPDVGDVVRIVPVHTCVVTNMHGTIYGVRGDQVVTEWEVAARGKVW
ncbi:MAG: alanine racemase [bacterium]|nr:alanine racemase [bacterium]